MGAGKTERCLADIDLQWIFLKAVLQDAAHQALWVLSEAAAGCCSFSFIILYAEEKAVCLPAYGCF